MQYLNYVVGEHLEIRSLHYAPIYPPHSERGRLLFKGIAHVARAMPNTSSDVVYMLCFYMFYICLYCLYVCMLFIFYFYMLIF